MQNLSQRPSWVPRAGWRLATLILSDSERAEPLHSADDILCLVDLERVAGPTSAVLHRSMRIAAGMHVLLADSRQRTSLCHAGADPIRDHAVHRLVIGVPRFL